MIETAERTIKTYMIVTGAEAYIAEMEKLTVALKAANAAKKEFDALFGKAPNSTVDYTSSNCAPQ